MLSTKTCVCCPYDLKDFLKEAMMMMECRKKEIKMSVLRVKTSTLHFICGASKQPGVAMYNQPVS